MITVRICENLKYKILLVDNFIMKLRLLLQTRLWNVNSNFCQFLIELCILLSAPTSILTDVSPLIVEKDEDDKEEEKEGGDDDKKEEKKKIEKVSEHCEAIFLWKMS